MMEREKRIACFDCMHPQVVGYCEDVCKLTEAFDMAIEALSADRPKNMIHIDDVYRLIAGHSDYHGDSILSAFTCLVEGKDVKPIAPLDESAGRPKWEWTTEQVAEMLANLFGDECACNWSGIDEWLPLACKYADTQCPDPKEKHGCWMQFLIQGGGTGE